MSNEEKNWVMGPLDTMGRAFNFQGLPFPLFVVADLPEGGYVQMVNGDNPMALPVPGPQLAKGAMLVVIPAEVAQHLRKAMKEAEAQQRQGIGKPYVIGGKPVPAAAVERPN
ncbi:MAG TPA: hypothetical protein VJL31_13065 [Gemmatimonadales bacterium]|nr:hypothetical protein [Gemmatimonadales bacterium]